MALSFPLSVAVFMRALKVSRITFHLTSNITQNTTGKGEILRVGNGERYWYGRVYCDADDWADYEAQMVLVRELEDAAGTFLAFPYHMEKTSHPTGVLNAVSGKMARFSGLNAGRVLTRGQFFSYPYGSGQYGLHQLSEGVTADGTGLTPLGQVVPPVPSDIGTGQTCTFTTPVCKAVVKPGSVREPDIRSVIAEAWSFDWQQSHS